MINYYLAYYKAVLDRNLDKIAELYALTVSQFYNYPEEHPSLNASEIFKDINRPMQTINYLLQTPEFEDFYCKISDLQNPLATLENIAIREASSLELMKHPLMDICPNDNFLVIDSLLSVMYSKVITKEEAITKLTTLLDKSSIINDVLSVAVIANTINVRKIPSIHLIDEKMENYDPTFDSNTGGYYSAPRNKLVVTNENNEFNTKFFVHELVHKIMKELFNNSANPYNNNFLRDKYHAAVKKTLLNIQAFIKQDFVLDIDFEDQNDTFQMGKTLSSLLFPQYLEDGNIQEFISVLQKNNLNINDEFLWLDGYSPLGLSLSALRFKIADSLLAAGATVKPEILHAASILSNKELINWFFDNAAMIDINYKDCEGMTASDYANDPEIISTLISAGGIVYPPNFEPICSIDPKCEDTEEDVIITKQLKALEKLLNFYNQGYDSKDEDAELIVRLPQIIAEGLYEGKIVEVLAPLAEYWQEFISPAAALYQEQHYISGMCLAPLMYGDLS